MPSLLPHRFLFRYSLPVRFERKLPRPGRKPLGLSADFALPDFAALDDEKSFGELRLAWNEKGLGVSIEVKGRKRLPQCDPNSLEWSDGLRLFIDTRNTQNIHRASRYCQQFCLMPRGGGTDGTEPCAVQVTILRAREEAPRANVKEIRMGADVSKTGYSLEAWLPASVLHGYDPEAQPRLGFYYALIDGDHEGQFLSVGSEFPFAVDPSLWSTLELVR